jgi:hypothetical protein
MLANNNERRFCLASNDNELRRAARLVPGVPICFFVRGFAMMEQVSAASSDVVAVRALAAKKEAQEDVAKFLKLPPTLLTPAQVASQQASAAAKLKPAKRKFQGTVMKVAAAPNPLSVKKKKRVAPEPSAPPKKRRRRKAPVADAAAAVPAAAAVDVSGALVDVGAEPAATTPPTTSTTTTTQPPPADAVDEKRPAKRRVPKKRGSRGGKRTHTAKKKTAI